MVNFSYFFENKIFRVVNFCKFLENKGVSKNIIIVTCFEKSASLKFFSPYKNEKRGEAGQKQLLKQDSYGYKFRRSVCRVKIKKKNKNI